ncbi:sensor histidine kinase [Aeromicrobium sp. Root495]|uniref:sensor histidine kinase n=1 Tax=Aeromicrobium sp. Root495 TaxID=1736550 RepID=UPI000B1790B6|nr:histidine kinase [Aeromicrobium sp. Root495]
MTTQPPISTWGHVWRTALVVLISALAWWDLGRWQWDNARWWFWLDLGLGLASLLLVQYRRRWPVTVAVVVTIASAFSGTTGGPATLALFSLATRRRSREIVGLVALSVLAGLVLVSQDPSEQESPLLTLGFMLAIIGVTVGWGMYVGSRRELLWTLRERAQRAEAEQAARVSQARTAERARIAREMHDVLAHRISMVAMHAGALSFRDDLTAEQVKQTATVIQENSHRALAELREVLGVLRDHPGDAVPEPPQPSAIEVVDLVREAAEAGMNIEVDGLELLAQVPDSIGRTAYRAVQEGLTNARKHAPDTLVNVTTSGSPGSGLQIEVSNRLPIGRDLGTPESGLGLVGLAERAELAGGRLTRIRDGRSFTLRLWLPWPA